MLAFMYVAAGFGSVGLYSPPVGDVMAFYAQAVTVLATATGPVMIIIAGLFAVPRFRRFFALALKGSSERDRKESSQG